MTNLPESSRPASGHELQDVANPRLPWRSRRGNVAIRRKTGALHFGSDLHDVKKSRRPSGAARRKAGIRPETDAMHSEIALQNVKNSGRQRPALPKFRRHCDSRAREEGASICANFANPAPKTL